MSDAIPEVVRRKALSLDAATWIDNLPTLVASLEREWSVTVGRPYTDATEAFVAEATLEDGTPAVVKLLIPRSDAATANEITALRIADGRGCVRLLRDDIERDALLLERLGPSLSDLRLPMPRRHEILCTTAMQLWRPAPECGLPSGADKGRWLAQFITTLWEELAHPCSERAIDHALACAARRVAAHDDERAVLVHGDVHQWNTLQSDDGFKLVDPDGLRADAAYDMGIVMREDPLELLDGDPRQRARWLAVRTGLNVDAIWEWGVVERVSTGLLGIRDGLEPVASQMLDVADRVAE